MPPTNAMQPRLDAPHPGTHLAEAQALLSQCRYAQAEPLFARLAHADPASEATLHYARCLIGLEERERAANMLRAYVEHHPDQWRAWDLLGAALSHTHREEAVAALRKALALHDNPDSHTRMAMTLHACNRFEEARRHGLRSLELRDQQSLKTFAQSPFSSYRLKEGGRSFDPEYRGRNIIAFSLWGLRPEYISGAIVNAQLARHIYLGWTARFYCGPDVPQLALEALRFYGAQTVIMKRPEDTQIKMMWRFLASDAPNINVFLVRDADSRLNPQELLAVTAWLKSGKRFHVMRDHIAHCGPIMGGMWGGTAGVLPNLREWILASPNYFGERNVDQYFLWDMVWPLIRDDACCHDSVYGFHGGGPFPEGYRLPHTHHVGGGVKNMPHWSRYYAPEPPLPSRP